jgi:hypothetical protein
MTDRITNLEEVAKHLSKRDMFILTAALENARNNWERVAAMPGNMDTRASFGEMAHEARCLIVEMDGAELEVWG